MHRLVLMVLLLSLSACDKKPEIGTTPAPPLAPKANPAARPKVEPLPEPAEPLPEPSGFVLESVPDDASGFSFRLMDGAEPAKVPDALREGLTSASSAALLHEGRVVVYQNGELLMSHVFATKQDTKLVTFFPDADVAELFVAPSARRVAILSRNPAREDYGTKLFVLDVDAEGALTAKRRFTLDPAPLIRCFASCQPSEVIFESDDLIRYLVSGGPEDPVNADSPKVYDVVTVR